MKRVVPLPSACAVLVLLVFAIPAQAGGSPQLVNAQWNHVTDALGFRWDLNQSGMISDGLSDCFDGGLQLKINGSTFNGSQALMTVDGSEYVLTQTFGDIVVTRRVRIDVKRGGARYIESFRNSGASKQSIGAEVESNLGSTCHSVLTTSGKVFSGGVLGKRDIGIVAIQQSSNSRPSALFLTGQARGSLKPNVRVDNKRRVVARYDFTLRPGQTKSILHWVLQRRANSPQAIEAAIEPFYKRRRLVDPAIPESPDGLVRSIINFGVAHLSQQDGLQVLMEPLAAFVDSISAESDEHDVLWYSDEYEIGGTLQGTGVDVVGKYGESRVLLEDIAAIRGGAGLNRRPAVYLKDGEVLTGTLAVDQLALQISDGDLDMPLAINELHAVVRKTAAGRPPVEPGLYCLVTTRDGERFSVVPDSLPTVSLVSAWGELSIPMASLEILTRIAEPRPGFRVSLVDHSSLDVFIPPQEFEFHSRRFGTIRVPSSDVTEVLRVNIASEEEPEKKPDALIDELGVPHFRLRGETIMAGRLDQPILRMRTEGGQHDVPCDTIETIQRDDEDERRFVVRTTDGNMLTGLIADSVLALHACGKRWRIPLDHVESFQMPQPSADPPATSDEDPDNEQGESEARSERPAGVETRNGGTADIYMRKLKEELPTQPMRRS